MSVGQYLQHYAEVEARLFGETKHYYDHVLTIPAFNEPDTLIPRLKALNITRPILVILVLNAPDKAGIKDEVLATQALAKKIKQTYSELEKFSSTIHLLELEKKYSQHLLLIERCDSGKFIPEKEGVGLARKIACDIATILIASGKINSHWIHTTDADVCLPPLYFDAIKTLNHMEVGAALYPFQHQKNPDPHIQQCQQLYELSLYYYVEGLRWANSIYAFHTIGSTLLLNFHAYALARGFPRRSAGEDFYLLNKMAKTAEIISLDDPVITIDSRESSRVPFGTGPAIIKISQLDNPLQDYLYYKPLCFKYLKHWLKILPELWELKAEKASLDSMFKSLKSNQSEIIEIEILLNCLQALGTEKALKHAYQHSKALETFLRHMNNWFDAFRTLKFIHFMRDALNNKGDASINASTLLTEANFLSDDLKERIKNL